MENMNVNLGTSQMVGSSKPTLPTAKADLMSVANSVKPYWEASGFVLVFATPADLQAAVDAVQQADSLKAQAIAGRRVESQKLRKLNAETDAAVSTLKVFLKALYKEDYASRTYAFGLEYSTKNGYVLPGGMNERLEAMQRLVKAIADNNLNVPGYEAGYWQDMLDKLKQSVEQSRTYAKEVTRQVIVKKEKTDFIKQVLRSLVLMVKANYPKEYKQVLRTWGILKETF